MTRTKIFIGLGVIGLAALLAFGGEGAPSHGERQAVTPESAATPSHGSTPGGIVSRRVDPHLPPGSWVAPGSALSEMQELANDAEDLNGLLMADYEQWKAFDGWVEGYADDSPFGDAVAECSAKYGGGINEGCAWNHDVVVKRTGDTTGKVVYINSRVDNANTSVGCGMLIKCFQDAWVDRPAPMPPGDQEHISMEALILGEHVAGAEGLGNAQRVAIYETALKELNETLGNGEPADDAHFSERHNYQSTKATRDHLVKVLEALRRS